jgi:hypothetical protein
MAVKVYVRVTALAALLGAIGCGFGAAASPGALVADSCVEDAQCAKLTVLENRGKPDGRTIQLRIVVLPALGRNNAQRSLDALLADCAASRECATAFPELRVRARTVFERLRRGPVTATVASAADRRGCGPTSSSVQASKDSKPVASRRSRGRAGRERRHGLRATCHVRRAA